MIEAALELHDLMVNLRTSPLTRDSHFCFRKEPAHLLVAVVAEFYIYHQLTSCALEEHYRRAVRASTSVDATSDDAVNADTPEVGDDALVEYANHDVTLGNNPFYSHLRHQVALIIGRIDQVERSEITCDNPAASNDYFLLGELIHSFFEGFIPKLDYVGGSNGRRHAYMAEGRAFLLHVYEEAGVTAETPRVGGIVRETCCIKLNSGGSIGRISNSIFYVIHSDSESEADSSEGGEQ